MSRESRRVFVPPPLSSPSPSFFTRRPSLPALAPGATSTLDLEHVPRTRPGTATCERRAWPCALCLLSRLYALADRSRDVSSRCEKGDRRWRRLILPRAGLFRKAKDDKGQSDREANGREGAERSLVYSSSRRIPAETITFKNNDRELPYIITLMRRFKITFQIRSPRDNMLNDRAVAGRIRHGEYYI